MWRKLVQSTYRRKGHRPATDDGPPTFADPEQEHVYFLGALAFLWSDIEAVLDTWVETVHNNGGAHEIQRQLPPNLDRELDYLAESLRLGFTLRGGVEEGKRIIQETHACKNFRHNLIHGTVIFRGGRTVCYHSKVRGAERLRMTTNYTRAQRARHYLRTQRLGRDMFAYVFGASEDDEQPRR